MKFLVSNMNCIHCQKKLEKALKEIGLRKIKFDLENKTVTVDLKKVTPLKVKEVVENIGYNYQEL